MSREFVFSVIGMIWQSLFMITALASFELATRFLIKYKDKESAYIAMAVMFSWLLLLVTLSKSF